LLFKQKAVFLDMTIMVAGFAAEIRMVLRTDIAMGQTFATERAQSRPGHVLVGCTSWERNSLIPSV
jgi:hypothetical protein